MKKVLFVTGTRADFGKLKPLMLAVNGSSEFRCTVFVTGMHTLERYGRTQNEVFRCGFQNIHVFHNQISFEPMDQILANTVSGLSRFIHENRPDLIVAHGDRVETLAAAIVGALNNILTAHIEGGERSGTVDELIRHSVTKLSHIHFVANNEAANRLRQMGEAPSAIYEIGSPDIDVMLSDDLPTLDQARERYGIGFEDYGILLFHPVTTEVEMLGRAVEALARAVLKSGRNWVVIYPNNDLGTDIILQAYNSQFSGCDRIKMFPSIRFEYFLVLLKHARVLLGNSSSGVREAPVYGVPAINVGSRQSLRYSGAGVVDVEPEEAVIEAEIDRQFSRPCGVGKAIPGMFGDGKSTERFMDALLSLGIWRTAPQKMFNDL
jgi:UDP-N-acetylglucosamine 2-epimerase (hydrolysing)